MCLRRRLSGCRAKRNATYERLCMSSSLLLTITESHGIRVLAAAIISIVGAIRVLGYGLRNLVRRKLQFAEQEADQPFWSYLLEGGNACARRVPVLWFDTSGGREGPIVRGLAPQLVYCNLSYSQAHPLSNERTPDGRGWGGFRT